MTKTTCYLYTHLLYVILHTLPTLLILFTLLCGGMAQLNFDTLNVRGLGQYKKRKLIFNHFRENKTDIAFIQETHSSPEKSDRWNAEAGIRGYWAHGTTNARGAAIIIYNRKVQALEYTADAKGRYVIASVQHENEVFTVGCVYAPNNDDPGFFEEFFCRYQTVQQCQCHHSWGLQYGTG